MAIETFGVTQADMEDHFNGQVLATLASGIVKWITRRAMEVETELEQRGFPPETVAGWGSNDRLYVRAKAIIIRLVCVDICHSATLQDVPLATAHERVADRLISQFNRQPESSTPNWDTDDQTGSVRTSKSFSAIDQDYSLKTRFYKGRTF